MSVFIPYRLVGEYVAYKGEYDAYGIFNIKDGERKIRP
jgi:hypothetical protein